jgi:hypothetical protein
LLLGWNEARSSAGRSSGFSSGRRLRAGSRAGQGEQAGLGLAQDASADEALELGAHAFDLLRFQPGIEGLAEVPGAEAVLGVLEDGQDLPVGRLGQDRVGGV